MTIVAPTDHTGGPEREDRPATDRRPRPAGGGAGPGAGCVASPGAGIVGPARGDVGRAHDPRHRRGAAGPVPRRRAALTERALFADYRGQIESASNQAFGLQGIEIPTEAPSPGTPVAVIDAQSTGIHSVVIEGTNPAQTRQGPGHIVGTAGPGQPGNSAVLGRNHLYGGPFGSIGDLAIGDRILVTTVQGQTAYTVRHVARHPIVEGSSSGPAASAASTSTTAAPAGANAAPPPLLPDGPVTLSQLYGPTDDDRLTLVTSDSALPWATGDALVVVARLDGEPFAPTPQGGRTVEGEGRHGDPGILAPLLLAGLFALAAIGTAVWLHRYLPWRSAYLLSAPLLVAAIILLAEQLAGALPAWT